jgi:hypothetical protein
MMKWSGGHADRSFTTGLSNPAGDSDLQVLSLTTPANPFGLSLFDCWPIGI